MGLTYETMRPGSFDTKARLADMDADGIYAQVLYPSVTLKGAKIYSDDRELQTLCVRAYNEWLLEFCSGSGGRLIGQAILPTTGLEDCIAELEFAIRSGHRGAVISSMPSGGFDPKPEDDRFWALAEEAGFPIAIHIGSFVRGDLARKGGSWSSLAFVGTAALTKAGGQTLPVVCDILFSGIFQRFPRLKIVLVESNIGWIPTLLEQSDDMFMRYRWYTGRGERAEGDAERDLLPQFLGDLHGRHRRHGPAPPHERRPHHVVDRLPAQRLGLAELAPHDRARLPRRPEGRGEEDAAQQLQAALPPRADPGPAGRALASAAPAARAASAQGERSP